MVKLSAEVTLFGLDLSSAWMHLRQIGRGLPLFQWLAQAIPATPVALLQANPDLDAVRTAQQVRLRADQWLGPAQQADDRPARFHALLLPEDAILTRTLRPSQPWGRKTWSQRLSWKCWLLSHLPHKTPSAPTKPSPKPSNRQAASAV